MSDSCFDARVLDASVEFVHRPFLTPLHLSSGTITEITEACAEVTIEANGRRATGRGAICLSNLWSWPHPMMTCEERDMEMRRYAKRIAAEMPEIVSNAGGAAHPLEIGLRLHKLVRSDTDDAVPTLARLVSSSPFDAALHDAAGQAYDCSAFDLYESDCPVPSADSLFPGQGACEAIREMLRKPYREGLNATFIVGHGSDASEIDPWVLGRGYRVFKIKTGGVDAEEDAARVVEIYNRALDLGACVPRISIDCNCAAVDSAYVSRLLDILEAMNPCAYKNLESIEQPTGRDIVLNAYNWSEMGRRKPLLLDEGLTDFETLVLAHEQGWNGMAVKTCRGHSFSLTAAAWAHQHDWKLTMMDLTNGGIAAIHSSLFAAHLPGVYAMEMNSAQYAPSANAEWLPRLAPLLDPYDGCHRLPSPPPIGLGSRL